MQSLGLTIIHTRLKFQPKLAEAVTKIKQPTKRHWPLTNLMQNISLAVTFSVCYRYVVF